MRHRSPLAERRNAMLAMIPAVVYPTPTVTGFSPASLDADGGETLTLTGTGFRIPGSGAGFIDSVTHIRIGTYLATGVSVASATSLTCVTPAMADGTYAIWLRSSGGDAFGGMATVSSGVVTFRILLETGDVLLTEAGDALRTE